MTGAKSKPIVNVSNDTWQNARRGVWTCPFCRFDARDDMEAWERNATKLILEPKIWKPGCIAFFSECPECFENSWIHIELRSFQWGYQSLPANWRKKGKALFKQAMDNAQKELEASLCFGCTWSMVSSRKGRYRRREMQKVFAPLTRNQETIDEH